MPPTLALVGRPNVGKSTLFNRLTRGRSALVADVPGLTRDRRYGRAQFGEKFCTLVDTGGLFGEAGALQSALEHQAQLALDECDAILFLVDAREGLCPADEEIALRLRPRGKPIILVVNKIDGVRQDAVEAEFSRLGIADTVFVSATHGRGMASLEALLAPYLAAEHAAVEAANGAIRVAVVGRPNVGKSTLINRLLGEERQVVFDAPGTTRDAIEIPFTGEGGQSYVLIDTAGVRRKGRVDDVAEKFSVVHALQAMERAHVSILVLDAKEGVVDQDLHVLSYAAEAGCGLLVAVNKWDGMTTAQKEATRRTLDRRLAFAPWLLIRRISALHGTGVGKLLAAVDRVYRAGELEASPSRLTRLLNQLVAAHPPPTVRGRTVKLRYAHKVGAHPPRIIVHGNQTQSVPASYVRYLENGFRDALGLGGNPVVVELRSGENPYAHKRNTLTQRQANRRRRLITHRKRRSRR